MPSLIFLAGPIAGRRYKLGEGEYVIGRRSDCQIFVPDMRVSRQHARLWREGEQWSLEEVDERLESAMKRAYQEVTQFARTKKCDLRIAAYAVALSRLEVVYKEREIFP